MFNRKYSDFHFKNGSLKIGMKTYIAGIINVNPDSFSDGGMFEDVDSAMLRAKEMIEAGIDIIDIGGESTRPGYKSVDSEIEVSRVIPVIRRLRSEFNTIISVDTQKAEVAKLAMDAGANIINDIWGLQGDPGMAEVVAETDAGVIIMHNSDKGIYGDIIEEILEFFRKSIKIALAAGVSEAKIIIDPGIGFAKTYDDNIEILSNLSDLNVLGMPILLGTSRKSFIGSILDKPAHERIEGSLATGVLGIAAGVDVLRVHDYEETKRASKISDVIVRREHG